MNQNTFLVSLINLKEKILKWYEKSEKVVRPIWKGLFAFAVLVATARMFPFQPTRNLYLFLAALALVQAFLPLSFLYYISSALILFSLWKVGFDIFAAFAILVVICTVGYFRIDGHYSYLAAIVPVLFFGKMGVAVPAVLAVAVGMEALFPAVVGVVVYYFSMSIRAESALLGGNAAGVGIGLQHVLRDLMENKTFLVMAVSVGAVIIITSLLRKAFYERAWLIAGTIGNTAMAFFVLVGCVYCDIDTAVWLVIVEAVLGMILCGVVEFFRGIGDVSRVEKTVFEDDEYIYYVKAVPKIRVSESDPNVKNMNESLYEEEEDTSLDEELEDVDTDTEKIFAGEADTDMTEGSADQLNTSEVPEETADVGESVESEESAGLEEFLESEESEESEKSEESGESAGSKETAGPEESAGSEDSVRSEESAE